MRTKVEGIEELKEVYIGNFTTYKNQIWPYELSQMEEKSDELSKKLKRLDLIKKWEQITGSDFKAESYEIILVSAIEGGPNANSLGYSRNVFYSGSENGFILDFISHEVGTHILSDALFEFLKSSSIESEKMAEFYSAYECLSQFLNSLVLNRKLSYDLKQFNSKHYISVYKKLYNDGVKKPKDLLKSVCGE